MPAVNNAPDANGSLSYLYDGFVALSGEQSTRDNNAKYADTYTYYFLSDAAANLTKIRGAQNDPPSQSYDADNRLSGVGYVFDGEGNAKRMKDEG